ERYFQLGGNCLYLHGEGEETHSRKTTGRWLRERRLLREVFLCTQVCHDLWDEASQSPIDRFTATAVHEDIDRDMTLIGVDHIELVGLGDKPHVPFEPVLEALSDAIAQGHIRAYGLSNWSVARIQQAINYARRKKIRTPAAIFTTELSLLYSTGPLWPEYFPF